MRQSRDQAEKYRRMPHDWAEERRIWRGKFTDRYCRGLQRALQQGNDALVNLSQNQCGLQGCGTGFECTETPKRNGSGMGDIFLCAGSLVAASIVISIGLFVIGRAVKAENAVELEEWERV